MESPDRKDNIPPAVDQGSPFFKYLCNLSPIKSTRPRHVVQTYAELSMPPPPAVFTSPPNPNKCGRVRRGLGVSNFVARSAWSVDKENLPNHSYVTRSFTAIQAEAGHASSHETLAYVSHQSTSIKQEPAEKHQDASPKYDFGDVSEYLTEPVDSSLYNASKTSFFMVKTSTVCEEFEYEIEDKNHLASHDEPSSSQLLSRASTAGDDSRDVSKSNVVVHVTSDNNQHQAEKICSQEAGEDTGPRAICQSNDQRNSDGSATRSNDHALQLDQETAAMAFLLVGDADGDGGTVSHWSAGHQTTLPDFSQQQSPDFSGAERISDCTDLRMSEEFDAAASNSVIDNRHTATELRESTEDERRNVLVSGALSQRGVRRRCLDFEAVRRKSMGGGVHGKPLGLRPKSIGGPSDLTTSNNVPPSILCERAAASSDATNSSCSNGANEESHFNTPGQHRPNMSGTNVKSPGLLRLTTFQRELSSSEKMVVETTRTMLESSAIRTAPSGIGLHLNSLTGNSGLHLNSLTGSISFSPSNREVTQTLCIGSASKGSVASLLGLQGLSGNPNELRCENFTASIGGVGTVSKSYGRNSSTTHYGSGVSVPFVDPNRLIPGDAPHINEMGREIAKGNGLSVSAAGARQSLEGSKSSGADAHDKKAFSMGKRRLLHPEVLQQGNLDFAEENESPRSPKKKRKSPAAAGEKSGEGCKRCNCKKSKCLKLYCECFAAGTYCVGSCTCHDCFNKPEHEETVLATRQQIESRNPLAFAPKIIHASDSSPKRGEEVIETPASARHKRGCNCKKSLCLKKYCECYQAGVGCSEGCRCEGCKNIYGRKEVNEEIDEKEIQLEALEKDSQEDHDELPKPDLGDSGVKLEQQRHAGKDLSPITPSVQYTVQGRTMGRTRSMGKKRLSSPLPQPRCGLLQRSPTDSSQSSMNICSESSLAAHQNPEFQLSKIERSPNSTPKFTRISQLSPRWERLGDICTLTPLPQAPLRPTPASISTLERTGASPCFNRQSMEAVSSYKSDLVDFTSLGKPSSFQLPPDESPLSPSNGRSSQSTSRQTPCTPCVSSSAFTGKDDVKFGENRSSQFGGYTQEDDDTPAFLRYSEDGNSPLITKSRSPKQKRVSPPHFDGLREKCRGDGRNIFDSPAGSSPGLRSSRKFILTAISGAPSPLSSMGPTVQGHIGNNQNKG